MAKAGLSESDVHKQEQVHFDQAVKLYQAKDYEQARKEFRAMLDLNIAGSTLKPQAENYLGKIRQTGTDQKTYDNAVQAAKDESWVEARDQFQELINRKGAQSSETKEASANCREGAASGEYRLKTPFAPDHSARPRLNWTTRNNGTKPTTNC